MKHPVIVSLLHRDPRYAYEAYEFMFEALTHTQKMFDRSPKVGEEPGKEHHVTGPEIVRGAVDLARREYGLLAQTVFHQWGVRRTSDLGELVFNLIESQLLSKTDTDSREDFRDVFDLDRALVESFAISLSNSDTASASKKGVR